MTDNEAGGWARGYAACREAQRAELEWQRAEIERLRAALREIIELKPEDMYHAVEHSMAAAIARNALEQQSGGAELPHVKDG